MAALTYLVADLRTNELLGELPFTSVTFDRKLNGVGTFSGTLNPETITSADVWDLTSPTNRVIYVDLGGELVWGGIIWTNTYQQSNRTLQVGGSDFSSYYRHRLLTPGTLDPTSIETPPGTFNANFLDQLTVAQDLINKVLAYHDDLGVYPVTADSPTEAFYPAVTYLGNEFKGLDQALSDLASGDVEMNFGVDVSYVAGVPTRNVFITPHLGRYFDQATSPVFDLSGSSCVDYQWPQNGDGSSNDVYYLGSGSGASSDDGGPLVVNVKDSDAYAAATGYPLLQTSVSAKAIDSADLLAGMAQGYLAAVDGPVTVPVLTWDLSGSPALGEFGLGDAIRVVSDPCIRFPDGLDADPYIIGQFEYDGSWRIVGWQVTDNAAGVNTIQLTLNRPEAVATSGGQ